MRKIGRWVGCYTTILLLFYLACIPRVFAANEFGTNYAVHYQVRSDGTVGVTQDVSLTNKLSNVYATQYALTLEGGEIQNIRAWDKEGALTIKTLNQNNQTTIQLTFNYQAVGLGKTLDFHLAYDLLDLAQKNGQVWEVSIPKLSPETEVDSYSLTLAVPLGFGKPAYIIPQPTNQAQEANQLIFHFNKEQILDSGVKAVFGQCQIFDFILTYDLENPNSTFGETEISLPPDSAFQRVFYERIDPQPLNVRTDQDGNWLAKYQLKPKEKLTVAAKGKAKIFAEPQEHFSPISQEALAKSLTPQKYWEIDHPLIREKAKNLKTPRDVYQFVVRTLDYDYSRVAKGIQRLGALAALQNPSRAICTEFADLFIALARAAGIPAREANGYAYTTNKKFKPLGLMADILHAWPEYWDSERKIWVPIDPTWEKTTGGIDHFYKTDLNHFAFTFHGGDSQLPYPAGSYKTEESFGRQVQIVFGQYEPQNESRHEVNFELPETLLSPVGGQGKVIIKNIGNSALYDLKINLQGRNIKIEMNPSWQENIAILPPYAQKEITFRLKPTGLLSSKQSLVLARINDQEYSSPVKIVFLPHQLGLPLGITGILALALFFVLKRKQ